jgi:hypothetical protein
MKKKYVEVLERRWIFYVHHIGQWAVNSKVNTKEVL